MRSVNQRAGLIVFCDLFVVTVVGQIVKYAQLVDKGLVSCPAKYTVLPLLPCEMANFQGGGLNHPSYPLKFPPCIHYIAMFQSFNPKDTLFKDSDGFRGAMTPRPTLLIAQMGPRV